MGDNKNYQALKKAISLFEEAQNAYDFKAFTIAGKMREEATNLLRISFEKSQLLQVQHADTWKLLQRGDTFVEFSTSQLEQTVWD